MCDHKERVGHKITSSLCSSEMIFRPAFDSLESDAGHFLLLIFRGVAEYCDILPLLLFLIFCISIWNW